MYGGKRNIFLAFYEILRVFILKFYDAGGLFDATDSGKDGGYVSEETAFRL